MERFFGGNPLAVALRLAIISLIVGVVLATLGLGPYEIFSGLDDLARWIADFGRDWAETALRWIITGAAIVLPIWLVWRLATALFPRRGR